MGDLIYVVSEGELDIVRELAGGGEELLWVAERGDYFGELGPLFHMPRSATARARTDATVIGYTVAAFRERLGVGGIRDLIEHRPLDMDDEHDAASYAGTRLSSRSGPIGSMPSNRQRCAWAIDSTPTSSTAVIGPPNRIGAT